MSSRTNPIGMSPSESRGLLLELARRQAGSKSPSDVLRQWTHDATVAPSGVDLRTINRFDALALEAAGDYEAILLSPVAPLGVNAVVAPTSQDRTLSTGRGTEVVSDPTNVLAVESARRLMSDPGTAVHLCTAHQTLRMQAASAAPGRSQHFRLFALSDAGRGLPDDGFEVAAVVRQIGVHHRLLDLCEREGLILRGRGLVLRSSAARSVLADRVRTALHAEWPDLEIERRPLESEYYDGLRVGFGAADRTGAFQEVVDLGMFDWVARFAGNARLRFVASAIGIQLLPLLF